MRKVIYNYSDIRHDATMGRNVAVYFSKAHPPPHFGVDITVSITFFSEENTAIQKKCNVT